MVEDNMPTCRRLLFGATNRVGRRLIVLIIAFSSLITLGISLVQLAVEYRELRSELEQQLDGVKIYVPSIAGSVWDFDEKQIQRALDALILLPNVAHVSIASKDTQTQWSAGQHPSASSVTREYPLPHQFRGQDTEIGTLTVAASLEGIYRQVATSAVTIVLSNGLKTFLVALFMVYLIRVLITSRLQLMARQAHALLPALPNLLPAEPMQTRPPPQLDELDVVGWALDQTGKRLHQALTDLSRNNETLRNSQQMLRIAAVAFESREAMMITDAKGSILRVNQAFIDNTGYAADEVVGLTPRILKSGRHDRQFYEAMWQAVVEKGTWQGEIWDRRKDGEIYPKWLTVTAVLDSQGQVSNYVGSHYDLSERKKADERINALAFFDQLTGLANRTLLLDRLKQALAVAARNGGYGALLFIDLDNFKTLNDTLGHEVGDILLEQVGRRLSQAVREGDTVARFGGDEFVVVLTGLGGGEENVAAAAEHVSDKILSSLGQTYQLGARDYQCTASVGVSLFHGDRVGCEDLMKQADLAMYKAKDAGRNMVRFFDPTLEAAVRERAALEEDLRVGLAQMQFLLYYQPQAAGQERLTGVEALVRWQHPRRGMVAPAHFIPLAEQTGLILALGRWVLFTACKQLAQWSAAPPFAHLRVAVNVSARQFKQAGFVAEVLEILEATGADPRLLKLEITESLLIENIQDTIDKMFALKTRGISFALDDFGTGYSSLAYLKLLPLDELKIDQSFVRDLLVDPNDAAIAKTVVALAQSLGMAVIAEGVETVEQRDYLAQAGCHAYQGFLFGRPVSASQFEALWSSDAAAHGR